MNTVELKNIVEFFEVHNCIVLPDDTLNLKQIQWLTSKNNERQARMLGYAVREGYDRCGRRVIPLWAARKSYGHFISYSRIQYWNVDSETVSRTKSEPLPPAPALQPPIGVREVDESLLSRIFNKEM
uniref:Uncharacterized protein n=1 Tax=Leviviridae sp. TaxID=2027243 RepID=A0A514D2B0_9VIRU|nr:MAG: hypothetical protein H4Bulk461623_000002 [Leviviridae sp.]